MPNLFKSGTTSTIGSIYKGQFTIAVVTSRDYGPTSATSFWNGIIPPSSGYTVYQNKASNGPSIRTASDDSSLVNILLSLGSTGSTAANVLDWASQQPNIMVANLDYPNILTSGITQNLDAGYVSSYPLQGSIWRDLSGNNLNGPFSNTTYSSLGSGSIVFNGTNAIINCGSNTNFAFGTGDFAIDAWIYRTGNGVSQGMWSTYRTGAANVGVKLGLGGGALDFRVGNDYGGALNGVTDSVTLTLNTWFYVVATRLNGTLSLYKNGVSVGTPTSSSLNITQQQLILGPWYPDLSSSFLFAGHIAVVRTYKGRGFTQADVTQNYNAQRSRFGL